MYGNRLCVWIIGYTCGQFLHLKYRIDVTDQMVWLRHSEDLNRDTPAKGRTELF